MKHKKLSVGATICVALFFCSLAYIRIISDPSPVNPDFQYLIQSLSETSSPFDYFLKLFRFQTLDFQPIRDLTFFIDIGIHRLTNWNSIIFQNVLWWVLSGAILVRLLQRRGFETQVSCLMVLGFLLYPLFVSTISWGFARKHIVAFFFILLATDEVEKEDGKLSRVYFFYILALLAHPIHILWSVWAVWKRKVQLKKYLPLIAVSVAFIILNKIYYSTSEVFLAHFPDLSLQSLHPPDMILALSHYFSQIFFPYFLSFRYYPGLYSDIAGLLVITGISIVLLKYKKDRSWILLVAGPLVMTLSNPGVRYDTYLLLPAAGILLSLPPLQPNKFLPWILSGMILFWGAFTFSETKFWTDEIAFTMRNFERQPSCKTARDALLSHYENEVTSPQELRAFIYREKCSGDGITGKTLLVLQSYLLFYEEDLPQEKRLERLRELSQKDFFPWVVMVAYQIRNGEKEEARAELKNLLSIWKSAKFRREYSPIVARYVYPFCQDEKNDECLLLMRPLVQKPDGLFYK